MIRCLAYSGVVLASLLAGGCVIGSGGRPAAAARPQWFKGNLHTHSLWSDGDDYPEMIADWYKRHGYHFLAISDHNVMHQGERWITVEDPGAAPGTEPPDGSGVALEKYLARFGEDWVEQRVRGGVREVRLKPFSEYRALLEEPGRFLMFPSEEITSYWHRPDPHDGSSRRFPIHVNATNLREPIPPIVGSSALDVMQRSVDAVLAQRERTGQAMVAHINHPNYQWAITAEELMRVRNERFFEVYNGHHQVHNAGDRAHLSLDAMWDVILTRRLTDLGLGVMYGLAVDDAHHHHEMRQDSANPGRGWIMVRARHLTPESIIRALEAGDFYATTGVVLADLQRTDDALIVSIQPEPGVAYVTTFIGTRVGYDASTEPMPAPDASSEIRPGSVPHRRYSADVGAELARVTGTRAVYRLRGDEIYVRAKIVSSKPKVNGSTPGEFETAWTQPLVPSRPGEHHAP